MGAGGGPSARVRAIRGATTVEEDRRDLIVTSTARLLEEMSRRNEVAPADVVSIVFTATEDLVSAFPAEAASTVGLGDAPRLCAREIPVPGALARCVRVLMHVETEREREAIEHVYLERARTLREGSPGG